MPGDLIEAHAEFEDDCDSCHAGEKKADQSKFCVACHSHEHIAEDIRQRRGFHGRFPAARSQPCRSCHTDHIGRDADVVLLESRTFDHSFTDFPLTGAHEAANCTQCHDEGKAYREAPSACAECHADDDIHKGRLGEECDTCHVDTSWSEAKFDHSTTDFPLVGKHRSVSCNLCHVAERYEETSTACVDCHRTEDVHRGRNGKDCKQCHQPESWEQIGFDHAQTRFPLTGRHRDVACESCHRAARAEQKPSTECVDCHRGDDIHQSRNGNACGDCHRTSGWEKVSFNHDADTDFPLRGAHQELRCESCHVEDPKVVQLETNCAACHGESDPHQGQLGERCESCHQESSWGERIRFDHDLTRFPLIGIHATTSCEECHADAAFRDTSSSCIDCHSDDFHRGRVGQSCGDCHNPNSWQLWLFDHNQQTDFELDGRHAELTCNDCHRRDVGDGSPALSMKCVSCHKSDDVHRGGFGSQCSRCHSTDSFESAVVQ